MKPFKTIFNFYINASIHVALAVVSLYVFTCIEFELKINTEVLIFVFLSSITGYNFVKYAPVAKLHHRSLTQQIREIQIFSFVVFLGLVICLFYISLKVIVICMILGAITLLYAIPIGRKNLREVSLLKVFVIAFIWATTTYILPFINDAFQWKDIPDIITFQFIERMLWVVLLMIPFEIRDLRFDKKYLKTLVSTFGIKLVKINSIGLLLFLFIHKLLFTNLDFIGVYLLIYLSLALVILMAKPIQKPYYSSFFVEAFPIFWMILILI
jgi:hypothetical protein